MHGTLQPLRQDGGQRPDAGDRAGHALMWAALLPLLLLIRPYEGLIQDARIYIGRGVADRDPAGIGQDIMFTADGQTGFTALRPVIRLLLGVLNPSQASMGLALFGILIWLGAMTVLIRCLARGRLAWAAAVCVLALQADYGAYNTFVYGESVATPRVFAEAAVLGALAALLGGRRLLALALLGVAMAFHPLMALPGLAIAAVMLAWEDRRWLIPIGAAAAAVLGAAVLKLPLAERLLVPMDATWLGILKARSVNLFPSLWNPETFAHTAARLAAVVVAGSFAPPRVRALLWAAGAVGVGGLGITALFGDRIPLVLVTQLQTWRALWPLAVLGNASVALAAFGLWRGGAGARLTLALLTLTWVAVPTPALAIGLAVLTIGLRFADARGALQAISPRITAAATVAAAVAVAVDTLVSGEALAAYLRAGREQGGETIYSFMLAPGVHIWPLVVGAIALALRPSRSIAAERSRREPVLAALGLAAASVAAITTWDSRTSEYRVVEGGGEAATDLHRLLGTGSGPVLWLDDYNEAWFLAGRPSFFSSMQGCPILFSRALALEWHDRGTNLVKAGLARSRDLSPWTAETASPESLSPSPAAVAGFCRDPLHPAAIVAAGDRRGAVPPGFAARLWHPPGPIQVLYGDHGDIRWRKIDVYTVIQCPAPAPSPASGAAQNPRDGDVRLTMP